MPPSLPRQAASLRLSVSSRNASVFAQSAEARHPLHCPRHFLSRYAGRTASLTRLQCSFYTTACRFARPTEMAPFVFTRVWNFYFRAFPHLVALIRVGYTYLSEQTIPRTGLSPAGITALWAARTPDWVKPADPASRLGTVSGQVQPVCYHTNPPSAYISVRATDMITSFQVNR
jgi:hypothetical protein